jgi:hypothetical protein
VPLRAGRTWFTPTSQTSMITWRARIHRAAHEALARCPIGFLIRDKEGFTQ